MEDEIPLDKDPKTVTDQVCAQSSEEKNSPRTEEEASFIEKQLSDDDDNTVIENEGDCKEKLETKDKDSRTEKKDSAETKNNFLTINRSLLHCKLLYFCYNSALGALWPYLPLYFKQLFLTPRQVGTIVASRTFVQFLCVPFWTGIADKYSRHKMILLLAIFSWLISTMALLIVPAEQPKACFKMGLKRTAENDNLEQAWFDFNLVNSLSFNRLQEDSKHAKREMNQVIKLYNTNSSNFTPKYSAYDPDQHVLDSSRLYLLLLCITIFGMMISAPSLILVDICTLQRLKGKTQHYGRQVLWGSVGFGLFAFTIGTAVNFIHSTNQCTKKVDFNYVPCFYVFAFFMTITLVIGSQFSFEYDKENAERPSFLKGLQSIRDIQLASLLAIAFYCGMGSGFISTFLFWHLREMGGMQLLMALVTLLNSTAEVLFYLLSDRIIHCIGHFRVIYIGLLCFAIRFFYYSFLREPWLVLPIEITHGMTSAAIRAALVSYLGKENRSNTVLQGLFNGVHSGLGFSIGGLTGGIMVHEFGHSTTFLIFGEVSLVMMFSFILVNNVWPDSETINLDDKLYETRAMSEVDTVEELSQSEAMIHQTKDESVALDISSILRTMELRKDK